MKYGITAATGHFGQAAIKALSQLVDSSSIVALARNVEKAQSILPAGIEVRPADYTDEAQMTASFKGIDKLLFVSSQPGSGMPRAEQHHQVVKAAVAAGVSFVAYTSFPNADHAHSFLAKDHQLTEGWLKESGLQYSFLRNNWYLQNDFATIQGALQSGQFPYSAGAGKVAWSREENYAAGAAKVLTLADPKSVYEFGGRPIDYPQLVAAVNEVSGKSIQPLPLTNEQYQQALLKGGLDKQTVGFVMGVQDLIRDGELSLASDDLNDVLDGQLESLQDGLKELLNK